MKQYLADSVRLNTRELQPKADAPVLEGEDSKNETAILNFILYEIQSRFNLRRSFIKKIIMEKQPQSGCPIVTPPNDYYNGSQY